jgi:hypothetical protein
MFVRLFPVHMTKTQGLPSYSQVVSTAPSWPDYVTTFSRSTKVSIS